VTPQVLANVKEFIGGDLNMFDGYEELSQENKDKVALAFKEGHVADEDWVGVSESFSCFQDANSHTFQSSITTIQKIKLRCTWLQKSLLSLRAVKMNPPPAPELMQPTQFRALFSLCPSQSS
jgi:hypothetical protein